MNKIIKKIVYISAFITFSILFFLIFYVLLKGIPHIDLSFFELNYTTDNLSVFPSIINTIILILLTLLISTPIGVFTAFYLVEYASKNNKFINIVRIAIEILSGIPSIIFGLFGMILFVIKFNFKYSMISGVLTSSIMVLPLIIITTEEALLSVDNSLREASYGLGANKTSTIFKVILPSAMPGIVSGMILAMGKIIGETAALIYTLGTVSQISTSIFDSGRTLALHMYLLSTEGMFIDKAFATGVILMILILVLNSISNFLANKIRKGM